MPNEKKENHPSELEKVVKPEPGTEIPKPKPLFEDLTKKKRMIDIKHWSGVLIVGLIAAGVIFGLIKFSSYLRERAQREAFQNLEAPSDTIGGSTPEETFDMFLSALKKGDTRLASRYFVASKQDQWLQNLEQIEREENLEIFIQDLEFYRARWQLISNDGFEARFLYEVVTTEEQLVELPNGEKASFSPGTYEYESVFSKNFSNVWKIDLI